MTVPKIPRGYTGYDFRNRYCPDSKLINLNGVYEPPLKTQIGNIPVVRVDPHHEVLPFWYKKDSYPRKVLHVDYHSDTCADVPSLESLQRQGISISMDEYVKKYLNIASFLAPAIFYKLIDRVFWLDPREETILEIDPNVHEEKGKIRFGYFNYRPWAHPISDEAVIRTLNQGFILDIDLDAFECIEDPDYWTRRRLSFGSVKFQRFLGRKNRRNRFSRVKNLLSQIEDPQIITIAASQTPITCVPPENAGFLELKTLDLLVELYQKA